MRFRLAILVLLVSLLPLAASSDVALFGTILDPTGAVVPNALVTAFNDDSGTRRSTMSDQEGLYTIAGLPPGHYKLLVRKEGFLTIVRAGLNLRPQQNARCDFGLKVGPVEQVVTVESGPSLLNSRPGSPGIVLGQRLIDGLPLEGRSLAGMLDLVPGVIATPANTGEAGQFTTSGQRPNTNYFTVDGVSFNTGVSGAGIPGQFPGGTLPSMTAIGSLHDLAPFDAIDEVQVQTSSFTPQFGSMPGAQVVILTRSGSNDFHATLSAEVNRDAFNADDWLANASALPRPAMRSNDLAASFGGPILRNRTFFFASYEQLDLRQPLVWWTPVPSQLSRETAPLEVAPLLSAFPTPNGPNLGQGLAELRVSTTRPAQVRVGSLRVDHALTSIINVFARYSNSPSWSEFGYSQVNRSDFRQNSWTAGITAAISPALSNDLRVNRTTATVQSAWTSTDAGGAGPLNLVTGLPGAVSFESLSIDGVGSLNVGDGGRNSQSQTNIVEGLAILRGNHHLRIGAEFQRLEPRTQGPALSVSLNFANLATMLAGAGGWFTNAQNTAVTTSLQTAAIYAQDTWTLNPRLTMTYGIRLELAPAPLSSPDHAVYAQSTVTPTAGVPIWCGGYSNIAPRVGLAWRMSSDARSVLRAGFGVFYDASFAASTDEINGAPYSSWQLGTPYGSATPSTGPALLYGFAAGLRIPRSEEWNLSWQHAWGDRATTSISYIGSRGDDLLRREATLAPGSAVAELELATNHGSSTYQGLQAGYRQRLIAGLEGLLSYTWSHSIDTASWDSAVFLVQPGLSAADDRTSSNFDVRHTFSGAMSYDLKLPRGPRFLASGWSIDTIFRARTGFPIDVLAAETYEGLPFANVVRPSLVAGIPTWTTAPNVPGGRSLNPAAFTVSPNRLQGDLGRNAIRGFGMSQLDLALHKTFAIADRASLEFRAEVANALNHPDFADPERYLASALFGQSASMLNLMLGSGTPRSGLTPAFEIGGPRTIQIGLKLRF